MKLSFFQLIFLLTFFVLFFRSNSIWLDKLSKFVKFSIKTLKKHNSTWK